MIVVVNGNVRHDGKRYKAGDRIEDISPEQVERLQKLGLIQEVLEEDDAGPILSGESEQPGVGERDTGGSSKGRKAGKKGTGTVPDEE